MLQLILATALLGLVVGTYTDLRTREVPDWLNFGLIIAGLGLRSIWSLLEGNYMIIVSGLAGLAIFFLVSSAMYYSGQWGGGDSKLLMGLGALMGLDLPLQFSLYTLPDLVIFWIALLMVGAVYGLVWSGFLALRHRHAMFHEIIPAFRKSRAQLVFTIIGGGGLLVAAQVMQDPFLSLAAASLGGVAILTYFLFIFVRAVEKVCMIKDIPVTDLVEGDWIAEPVVVKKKEICGPDDKGIEREQIARLKELQVKTVRVKEGIPFVPPFLVAFLLTWVWPLKALLF